MEINKWDKRFLELAELVAGWSKDPSTKTGAVIVRPDKSVLSLGFNGFPKNLEDNPDLYSDREVKYSRIVHCTTPQHKTLTSDLRWVELGNLKVGDKLIAFDEEPQGEHKKARKYRTSYVQDILFAKELVFRVIFDDGSEIYTTAEHKWLVGIGHNNTRRWRRTDELRTERRAHKLSSKISKLFDVWTEATDYNSGWLSGLLDGEGCIRPEGGHAVSFAQRPGIVLNTGIEILKEKSLEFSTYPVATPMSGGLGKKDAMCVHIRGQLPDRMKLLGTIRPKRLLAKINPDLFGRLHNLPGRARSVVDVESVGNKDIIKVQTSTKTLIIDGFPTHNCEMNALIHAKSSVEGCTLYTWAFPSCDRCVVHMLQAGITRFVFPALPESLLSRWGASVDKTKSYLTEAGVEWLEVPSLSEVK